MTTPATAGFVRTNERGLVEVVGTTRRTAVYTGTDLCLASDDPPELLAELERRKRRTGLDPQSVSEFLHHGFVFAPRTVRAEVLELGVGDRLVVSEGYGYGATCEWPWLGARSRQDQTASTGRLLELMVAAVRRSVGSGPATLMLSSGKDSVGLALACAELGLPGVRATTFESDRGGEGGDAAAFASRLGLEHRTIRLPDDPDSIEHALHTYFERATIPCGDPTLVPYLLAVDGARMRPGEVIIDGLNSDAWMGLVPDRSVARGASRSERWFRWLRPLREFVGPEHPLSAVLRNRAEWHLYGGRWLRHAETRGFYEASVDTHRNLQQTSDALDILDDIDFRSMIVGRHFEQNGTKTKARAAAECFGLEAAFPFDDGELADYYFHLPEPDRFDRQTMTNKVLLRRLLRERLDYDDERLGKRVFEFDGAGFLRQHRAFVMDEITNCPLWNDRVEPLVAGLIGRPGALRKTWPSLLALFQLSGWITRHPFEGIDHEHGELSSPDHS